MSEKISITDAELDIMNVLWETEPCTSRFEQPQYKAISEKLMPSKAKS